MTTEEAMRLALRAAAAETGYVVQDNVAAYAAKRAAHLASIVDHPGFDVAVEAERDAVALYAGIYATDAQARAFRTGLGVALRIAALLI